MQKIYFQNILLIFDRISSALKKSFFYFSHKPFSAIPCNDIMACSFNISDSNSITQINHFIAFNFVILLDSNQACLALEGLQSIVVFFNQFLGAVLRTPNAHLNILFPCLQLFLSEGMFPSLLGC